MFADGIWPPHSHYIGKIQPDSTVKVIFSSTHYALNNNDKDYYGNQLIDMTNEFEAWYMRESSLYQSNFGYQLEESEDIKRLYRFLYKGQISNRLNVTGSSIRGGNWSIEPHHYFEVCIGNPSEKPKFQLVTVQEIIYDLSTHYLRGPEFYGFTDKLTMIDESDIGKYVVLTLVNKGNAIYPILSVDELQGDTLAAPLHIQGAIDSLYNEILLRDFHAAHNILEPDTIITSVIPVDLKHMGKGRDLVYIVNFTKFSTTYKYIITKKGEVLDINHFFTDTNNSSEVIDVSYFWTGYNRRYKHVYVIVYEYISHAALVHIYIWYPDKGFLKSITYLDWAAA